MTLEELENTSRVVDLSDDSSQCEFKYVKSSRLPMTLCEHSSAILDGILYVIGGQKR